MKIRQNLNRLKQFLLTVIHNVISDRIFFRATSLAFTSVLSLVPLTMVIFAFGGFDQLGLRILESMGKLLLPESNNELLEAFNTFTSNARRLGTWGTLLFLFAAIMLFNAMESHLNDIFRARPRKGPILRIGMYVASLALVSLIFGVGFGPITGILEAWRRLIPEQRIFGIILSILGSMIGMMMIFGLMSAARVKIKSALLGTFIGSLTLQAAKLGFTYWTIHSTRQSIIYGSVVFIPQLLIWLSVAWIVVLVSAEITYAHQTEAGRKTPLEHATPADETDIGWKVFLALADDFRLGKKPPGVKALASRLMVDERRVDECLKRLEDGGMVYQVVNQLVKFSPGFIPAVAPADLKASSVFSVITGWKNSREQAETNNDDAFSLIRIGIEKSLENRSVRSFLTNK